jgi:hypothetical protein
VQEPKSLFTFTLELGASFTASPSTFFTYQNNQINLNGNGNNIGGHALVALTFQ